MGRKRAPGLIKRSGHWHIDKTIGGRRICRSTETDCLEEAERVLARVIETSRQARVYGVRPTRTFEEAAARFVLEHQHKRSLRSDIGRLNGLVPAIGHLPIEQVHMGSLRPWVDSRQQSGVSNGTINHGLQLVRRILTLASGEWIDEQGLTWLHAAPAIRFLPNANKRLPYLLSWSEQARLFKALPDHLRDMALFAVNTGCRDAEICGLRWEWLETPVGLGASVFVIPRWISKNGDPRVVVLNRSASEIVDRLRSKRSDYVFTYRGRPLTRMNNSAWRTARERTGLSRVRIHDLRHAFGRRLRSAGVTLEDREDLLGHRSGRMTTHYSAPDLRRLLSAANRIVDDAPGVEELVMLKEPVVSSPANLPQSRGIERRRCAQTP